MAQMVTDARQHGEVVWDKQRCPVAARRPSLAYLYQPLLVLALLTRSRPPTTKCPCGHKREIPARSRARRPPACSAKAGTSWRHW